MSKANPSDSDTSLDWYCCFRDIIQYYQSCIDTRARQSLVGPNYERKSWVDGYPKTPREYFHRVRDWSDDTIKRACLGFAPPTTELIDSLRNNSYSEETIRATGLFDEKLQPLWRGRFVFPVLDTTGRPISAISRKTDRYSQPKDRWDDKHAMIDHSKPHIEGDPMVYGINSLREGEPVIIGRRVSDAITVQQEGYSCLAQHGETLSSGLVRPLIQHLQQTDVPRIYIFPNTESQEVKSLDRGHPPLTSSRGLKGAIETATTLSDNGLDVEFATLPWNGQDELELHEYIRDEGGSINRLMEKSVPVEDHPAYTKW